MNLGPIVIEKRWTDGESWPNDFVEKVNRGEDLRWVGSRCPLTHAIIVIYHGLIIQSNKAGTDHSYNWRIHVKEGINITIPSTDCHTHTDTIKFHHNFGRTDCFKYNVYTRFPVQFNHYLATLEISWLSVFLAFYLNVNYILNNPAGWMILN